MDENLSQLEFPLLLKRLAELILTPYGVPHLEAMSPHTDLSLLRMRLNEIDEMVGLLEGGHDIPLFEVTDIRPFLERVKPVDAFLETTEINQVKIHLQAFSDLSVFLKSFQDSCPHLIRYGERIHPHRAIVQEVEKTLDPQGEIRETASPELRKIRREIQQLENDQKKVLIRVLKRYSEFSQDDIVTMRDGRLVLGIQQQFVSRINGIVHGTSGTGATVFVEPMETLRISNQIQNLKMDERNEIIRILRFLTGLIREVRDDIHFSIENFGILDFIHAKARLSVILHAHTPIITEKIQLKLMDARHPLLIFKMGYDKVIPASLNLGEEASTLVITGPNAGGKTVTLKMVGVICAMARMGLHIPAHPDSVIPLLDRILVDIGDRQNLEQDLSTFSAHIIRLQEIAQNATDRSLVLIDEIGTGTDPREGSSLAIAFLQELTRRKIPTIATTHHGELKAFAFNTPGVENASMEFNLESLLPTYRLQVGIPGSSYAFEIARRYGLAESVLEEAIQLLGSEKNQLENLIISLNERLQDIEKDRREISIKLTESEGLRNLYQQELERLRKEKTELRRQAAHEARKIVQEANSTIEKLVADIRRTQAQKDKIRDARHKIEELKEMADQVLKDTQPETSQMEALQTGDVVWIENLREEGEVIGEPDSQNKVWVLVKDLRMQLPRAEMHKMSKNRAESYRILSDDDHRSDRLEAGMLPEVDLRGMDSYQAIEATNRYLDQAQQYGWEEVRIIHGKGTGVLRREVNSYLSRDQRILEKRLGKWGEGDTGVTIVRLKK